MIPDSFCPTENVDSRHQRGCCGQRTIHMWRFGLPFLHNLPQLRDPLFSSALYNNSYIFRLFSISSHYCDLLLPASLVSLHSELNQIYPLLPLGSALEREIRVAQEKETLLQNRSFASGLQCRRLWKFKHNGQGIPSLEDLNRAIRSVTSYKHTCMTD